MLQKQNQQIRWGALVSAVISIVRIQIMFLKSPFDHFSGGCLSWNFAWRWGRANYNLWSKFFTINESSSILLLYLWTKKQCGIKPVQRASFVQGKLVKSSFCFVSGVLYKHWPFKLKKIQIYWNTVPVVTFLIFWWNRNQKTYYGVAKLLYILAKLSII